MEALRWFLYDLTQEVSTHTNSQVPKITVKP